jgi:hypothetical protein
MRQPKSKIKRRLNPECMHPRPSLGLHQTSASRKPHEEQVAFESNQHLGCQEKATWRLQDVEQGSSQREQRCTKVARYETHLVNQISFGSTDYNDTDFPCVSLNHCCKSELPSLLSPTEQLRRVNV